MNSDATNEQPHRHSQVDLVIEDLSRRIGSLSVEVSSWRARALTAEATLAQQDAQDE